MENAILINLQSFIKELGNDFAFLERQKRISIDSTDYYLDLLFYHRRLNRFVRFLTRCKPGVCGQVDSA